MLNHSISIAPMMDWTDRHYRYFMRLLSKHTVLYTEMVHANAVIHNTDHILQYNDTEHPIVVQLGGSCPDALAKAARLAQSYQYDEINLNVGCPSSRVQAGAFGACLMKQPQLVADCVKAMRDSVSIPVTVKCRLGVDEFDDYDFVRQFIDTVAGAPCDTFIVHARKAWLNGLSPKENREVPPIEYEKVFQLKRDYPELKIIVNGQITDLAEAKSQFAALDGIMVGREAYQNPYCFANVDRDYFADSSAILSRSAAVEAYLPYVERQLGQGERLHSMTRHLVGLFHGQPRARAWRRHLSQFGPRYNAGIEVLEEALSLAGNAALDMTTE